MVADKITRIVVTVFKYALPIALVLLHLYEQTQH